jgi:hypothetical protein
MEFDEKYIKLVELHKQLRRDPDKEKQSNKALEAADKLLRSGKVSDEALEAARYI